MDKLGIDGAIFISAFSIYGYDSSYAVEAWKKHPGRFAGFDYDWEPVLQFGNFDGGELWAWTIATDTGYTFASVPWAPRIGLKADVASGDRDADDSTLGTFNPLFFKAGYFNDASLLRPGWRSHSITLVARSRSRGGILMTSISAVRRLMERSDMVG